MVVERFAQIDVDKDGFVTGKDFATYLMSTVTESLKKMWEFVVSIYDRNGDSQLQLDDEGLAADENMNKLDDNKDRVVTFKEYEAATMKKMHEEDPNHEQRMKDIAIEFDKNHDVNKDGKISFEEYRKTTFEPRKVFLDKSIECV